MFVCFRVGWGGGLSMFGLVTAGETASMPRSYPEPQSESIWNATVTLGLLVPESGSDGGLDRGRG